MNHPLVYLEKAPEVVRQRLVRCADGNDVSPSIVVVQNAVSLFAPPEVVVFASDPHTTRIQEKRNLASLQPSEPNRHPVYLGIKMEGGQQPRPILTAGFARYDERNAGDCRPRASLSDQSHLSDYCACSRVGSLVVGTRYRAADAWQRRLLQERSVKDSSLGCPPEDRSLSHSAARCLVPAGIGRRAASALQNSLHSLLPLLADPKTRTPAPILEGPIRCCSDIPVDSQEQMHPSSDGWSRLSQVPSFSSV